MIDDPSDQSPDDAETSHDATPSEADTALDAAKTSSRTIGPYRLLERIGKGGMGEVWLAEQVEPVRRRVAVKIIKRGMDTEQVVARFESERQALAMMDHPNIATVFDGGQTEAGGPYFAMEYVKGIAITNHCDTHRLAVRERLALFQKVCAGVQHAHQKAIIHRDLKPSNILVAIQDNEAVPKIIDFGVAKATAQRLTERTLYTEHGALIGTPEYMSPEQAEMTAQDIDTRTDVYSLGVVLYELLVGALPLDPKELRQAGLLEMHRVIREKDPSRPSTRISTLGGSATTNAAARRTQPIDLTRLLRGDLDWIAMKALEKDRTRRYDTPAELAADIGRYLRDEPILARPPSKSYKARKFLRRHRVGASVAAAAVVALVGFSVVTSVQARRIGRERDIAEAERAKVESVLRFTNDVLAQASPMMLGADATILDALDRAVERLESRRVSDDPLIAAEIRRNIANTFRNLAQNDKAAEQFTHILEMEGLEEWSEPRIEAAYQLGFVRQSQRRMDDAVELWTYLATEGPTNHWAVGESLRMVSLHLSSRGEANVAEALLRTRLEEWDRTGSGTTAILIGLARALEAAGKLDEAEASLREWDDLIMREGGRRGVYAGALADFLVRTGRGGCEAALPMYRGMYETKYASPEFAEVGTNLETDYGDCLVEVGEYEEAERVLLDAFARVSATYAPNRGQYVRHLQALISLYSEWGAVNEAYPKIEAALGASLTPPGMQAIHTWLGRELWTSGKCKLGEEAARRAIAVDPDAANASLHGVLGWCLRLQGRFDEAEQAFLEGLDSSPSDLGLLNGLYVVALQRSDTDKALEYEERYLEASPAGSGARVSARGHAFVRILLAAGRLEEAELAIAEAQGDFEGTPQESFFWSSAANAHVLEGQYERAAELFNRARRSDADRGNAGVLIAIGRLLATQGDPDGAAELFETALGVDPDNGVATRELARVLSMDGEFERSLRLLGDYAGDTPLGTKLRDVETERAIIEMARGRYAAAEDHLITTLASDPDHPAALLLLALSHAQQGQFSEAVAPAERAVGTSSGSSSYNVLGWVLVAGGLDLERGAELAQRALAMWGNDHLGAQAFDALGARSAGMSAYYPIPHHTLGVAALERGDTATAVSYLQQAVDLFPRRDDLRASLEAALASARRR